MRTNRYRNFTLIELVLMKYSFVELIATLEKFTISKQDNKTNIMMLKRLKDEIEEEILLQW